MQYYILHYFLNNKLLLLHKEKTFRLIDFQSPLFYVNQEE